mmetsp:Transcript_10824/g.13478  ORF Transcript_10824/g.13478 Transcript_10824/m.13478 type:complete len:152 (+) Transcript_10824:59-514(+)
MSSDDVKKGNFSDLLTSDPPKPKKLTVDDLTDVQKKTYEELKKLKYDDEIALNAAETFGANLSGALEFIKSDNHDDEYETTFLTEVKHGKKISNQDISDINKVLTTDADDAKDNNDNANNNGDGNDAGNDAGNEGDAVGDGNAGGDGNGDQ